MKITATDIEKQRDERHPDDIAMEREGIAEAAERIDAWFEENNAALIATIQTYRDDEATKLFEALREHFWAQYSDKPFPFKKREANK